MIHPDPFTLLGEMQVQDAIDAGRKLLGDTTPGKLIAISTPRGTATGHHAEEGKADAQAWAIIPQISPSPKPE